MTIGLVLTSAIRIVGMVVSVRLGVMMGYVRLVIMRYLYIETEMGNI